MRNPSPTLTGPFCERARLLPATRTTFPRVHFRGRRVGDFPPPTRKATWSWKSIAAAPYRDRRLTNPSSRRSISRQSSMRAAQSPTWIGWSISASSCRVQTGMRCVAKHAITRRRRGVDALRAAGGLATFGMKFTGCPIIRRRGITM